MKKLKFFIVAFTLLAVSTSAAVFGPIKPTNQLRTEIVDLLGPNCPYEYEKNECTAYVIFTVNTNKEIIILSVDSPNKKAESYLKNKLNYKKVSHKSTREGEIFLLPLRMIRE